MHTFGADEPYVKWHTILNGGWMVSSAKNSASPGTKSRRTRALRWARLAWTPGDSPLKHGYNFTVFTHTSCGKGVTIWCLIVLDMFLAVALYSTVEKKKKKGGGEKGAAFAALNPASGGEESLTACHLKAGRGPAPLCFSLYLNPRRKATGCQQCSVPPGLAGGGPEHW